MIPAANVRELAQTHARIEDPATAAIWIWREASQVWLVEVVPSMADDDRAEDPTYFNPGAGFRFPLALVVGNQRSLEDALHRDAKLARAVADGEIVLDGPDARHLVDLAKRLAAAT
jgi:hypothetical protein